MQITLGFTMRITVKTISLVLLAGALSSNAFADYRRDYRQHDHRWAPHVRQHGSDWVAPLLFLGLAGAVLGAAASQSSAPPMPYEPPPQRMYPPPVTYVEPAVVVPMPPPAPASVWYFCQSAGKYYPYTPVCPEGWRQVTPPQ
jgi:hypothetical protein